MSFRYFKDPRAFAYMAEGGEACHFCKSTTDCLDGEHFYGDNEIKAVCFSCMQAGRLIELDISANEIDESELDPNLVDIELVAKEITYCTPMLPTWQEALWPIKGGKPYRFVKIASRVDYASKQQFMESLADQSGDVDWLWDMLPDHKIESIDEGQYDLSFYLFDSDGDKLTIWDAN